MITFFAFMVFFVIAYLSNGIARPYNIIGIIVILLIFVLNFIYAMYAGFQANKGRYLKYPFFR